MSMQEVPMEKIFIAAVIILSLVAAASAQALHVVHLHMLKERDASKSCRFLTLHVGCDADEGAKVTFDVVPHKGKESAENLKLM
jgi:hypothetical protein